MKLRSVEEIGENLTVILRMDLDLPVENGQILDNSRLKKSISTVRLLLERNNRIVILGHRGRPSGKDETLSLKLVYLELMLLLEGNGDNTIESVFVDNLLDGKTIEEALKENQIVFGENTRFWEGEEKNDDEFLKGIMKVSQAFVNDAFSVAHRKNATVMLWQKMDTYYGLSFVEEAEKIEKAILNPDRPVTIVLGGAKEDKLSYLPDLIKVADKILIGGKLPKNKDKIKTNDKVIWAKLRDDGLDLSDEDIEKFIGIISISKTIIWAGAMGFFEDSKSKKGTEEIALAVARTEAYKIIAGGDTGASIRNLGLEEKINLICSGGGVMLELLTKGKLPAWED
jgi:phosphoglycerate kinase